MAVCVDRGHSRYEAADFSYATVQKRFCVLFTDRRTFDVRSPMAAPLCSPLPPNPAEIWLLM
jgi:hypothetical protein